MKELIRSWLKKHKVLSFLKHVRLNGMFNYELFVFVNVEGRFYSLEVVYDDTKILGGLRNLERQWLLTSGDENPSINGMHLDTILSSMLKGSETLEGCMEGISDITQEEFDKLMAEYAKRFLKDLYSVSTNSFSVSSVDFMDKKVPLVTVQFTFNGINQIPIRLMMGDPVLVKRRDYGSYTREFEDFVSVLGSISGGVQLYGEVEYETRRLV